MEMSDEREILPLRSAHMLWHVHDLDQQLATSSSAKYPRWRATTGSGKELSYFSEIVVVPNSKQADAYSYTHTTAMQDGQ